MEDNGHKHNNSGTKKKVMDSLMRVSKSTQYLQHGAG